MKRLPGFDFAVKSPDSRLPLWVTVCVVVLALLIQVQIHVFETDTYQGLRLHSSDLLIPVAGLLILWSLVTQSSRWPEWRLPGMYWWFAALTAVLTGALLNGYLETGNLSRWALFNKYTGWFVLLAYAGLGGWLASNYGRDAVRLFLKVYCAGFVIMLFVFTAHDLSQIFLFDEKKIPALDGLLKNRNAYAFLTVSTLALLTTLSLKPESPDKESAAWFARLTGAVWFLLPFFAYLNGSRAGMLAGLALFLVFALWGRVAFFRQAGIWFLIGAVALTALLAGTQDNEPFFRERQVQRAMAVYDKQEAKMGVSERVRLRVLRDSTELWRDHKVLGIGLGTFLSYSAREYADKPSLRIDIIESSLLWLLVETGLLGAGLFLIFFCLLLYALWRCGIARSGFEGCFCRGVLMVLITYGFMSLFHELLYARYLWLFIGMGMARFNHTGPSGSGIFLHRGSEENTEPLSLSRGESGLRETS